MDSHCENLPANSTVSGLVYLTTVYYVSAPDDVSKQSLISQQRLSSKILGLWIKNYLTTEAKHKLRSFRNSYTFNNQYYGYANVLFGS